MPQPSEPTSSPESVTPPSIALPTLVGSAIEQGTQEKPGERPSEDELTPVERKARALIAQFAAGEFEQATTDFDPVLLKALPPNKLKEVWRKSTEKLGDFARIARTKQSKVKQAGKEFDVIVAACEFESRVIDTRVVFTAEGKVGGLFFSAPRAAFVGQEDHYSGKLTTGNVQMRLVFHLGKAKSGGYAATMDSPDQQQNGIPFDSAEIDGDKVVMKAKGLAAEFEGKLTEEEKKLEGEWRQRGGKFPLSLEKFDGEPQANRPQTPKPPFPYQSVEVTYENAADDVKLAGTLTVPKGDGPHPAAILITGSGAQDRDETLFQQKPFWVIAEYLSRRGVAVLRVDDRGVGGSSGNVNESTSADFAGDVLSGIAFLKSRKEIDPQRIGLIGHSEGGLVAPLVAAKSSDVAFIVLLAGPAFPGTEILFQQGRALLKAGGASEADLVAQRELQAKIFAIIEQTPDVDEARKLVATVAKDATVSKLPAGPDRESQAEAAGEAQARQVVSPWFRFFFKHDPRETLRQVKCPVLALNGEKDLQVLPQENLEGIRKILTESGNKRFEVVEFPGLNHLFQTAKSGLPLEYGQIEETIAPVVLDKLEKWIQESCRPGN